MTKAESSFFTLSPANQWLVIFSAGLASGIALLALQPRFATYNISKFIDVDAVAGIADSLPDDRDAFILSAWEIAGGDIEYSAYGSILHFWNDMVSCKNCMLPAQALRQEKANCVGKSQVLVSLLRNRMPPDEVYMAIGGLNLDGIGGHSWVVVKRQGEWYLLEATIPPPARPWIPTSALASSYVAEAYVNDTGLFCFDNEICTFIHEADLTVKKADPRRLIYQSI